MAPQATIRIPEGNAFVLLLPVLYRTYDKGVAVDTPLDPSDLTAVVVKVNETQWLDYKSRNEKLALSFPGTLEKKVYSVDVTAKYDGVDIAVHYRSVFRIVRWNEESDWQNYIDGSPVSAKSAYCIAPIIVAGEELERAIEAYVAEKERHEAAADALEQAKQNIDNIVTNTKIDEAVETILGAISGIDTYVALSESELDGIVSDEDDEESSSESEEEESSNE